jgi:hypothetical protein
MLTRAQAAVERQGIGEEDRWQVELIGGMEESTKSLEERGRRRENDRGWECPFIGVGGVSGRW